MHPTGEAVWKWMLVRGYGKPLSRFCGFIECHGLSVGQFIGRPRRGLDDDGFAGEHVPTSRTVLFHGEYCVQRDRDLKRTLIG